MKNWNFLLKIVAPMTVVPLQPAAHGADPAAVAESADPEAQRAQALLAKATGDEILLLGAGVLWMRQPTLLLRRGRHLARRGGWRN